MLFYKVGFVCSLENGEIIFLVNTITDYFFLIFALEDCVYLLEPLLQGSSNENPQSLVEAKIKEIINKLIRNVSFYRSDSHST